jgi:activating signal cointegrator 1
MKALTLTQPWATLVDLRKKHIETRSWTTKYRGLLVIHAAKGFPVWAKELCTDDVFLEALGDLTWKTVPLSRGLCIVRLVDVQRTEDVRACYPDRFPHEEPFGDYSEGRFAWVTEYVKHLDDPREVRGALGLWEWPEG